VVIHDADTERTTNAKAKVASRSLEEIRTLDAGSWKGSKWKGERIPTLSEALQSIPNGKRLFVEIKCGPEVLPVLEGVLRDSGKKAEQVVLIGFGYATMAKARQRFPKSAVYWIVGYDADKKTGKHPELAALIQKARVAGFDGLDLDFHFPINSAFVAKIKEAGLQLYVWTVDDAAIAARLKAAGVHGITTNRPGWLRQELR
jgi:glycerophosphoryl diester phosphodiesterase